MERRVDCCNLLDVQLIFIIAYIIMLTNSLIRWQSSRLFDSLNLMPVFRDINHNLSDKTIAVCLATFHNTFLDLFCPWNEEKHSQMLFFKQNNYYLNLWLTYREY